MDNDVMSAYTVVFDGLHHLGPGDPSTTSKLAERLRPDLPSEPRIADFGCGVGASALVLAQNLPDAHVLAIDSHPPFVARLASAASSLGLADRITATVGDMRDPPPLDGEAGGFDLIWSESSIYNLGRSDAFARWRPLLKPGGWLVFSEVIWQNEPAARSARASAFWTREYPEIATANVIVNELIAADFNPLDPVLCGRQSWSNYYEPLRQRLRWLAKQGDRAQALTDLMIGFEWEIDIFDCCGDEVALCFFLARRESPHQ